jgi:hypothetical protein
MTDEKLFEVLGDVNEQYVKQAHEVAPKAAKPAWVKWSAIAACLAVMAYAGVRFFLQKAPEETPESPVLQEQGADSDSTGNASESPALPENGNGTDSASEASDLPMLTVGDNTSSSMGFEGYLAYNSSELVNANPWNESLALSTLPVYRNLLTYDESSIASGADWGKMRSLLLEVAERLGLDTDSVTVTDNTPDEELKQQIIEKFEAVGDTVPDGYFDPTELIVEADGLRITVDQSMTVAVSFQPAIALPEAYHFTADASSYEEMEAVAEYLKTEYRDFIGMENPQVNIYGGDYTYDGQQMYRIEFFDASGTDAEQIVQYNFDRVAFYCNDEGELFLARVYQPDLSEKVGDYPIITSEQALELLVNGTYLTTVPYEMPGAEYVKKVELVYRTGQQETYYMPYYRFYVELPEAEQENGLKTYGAYYVPAVSAAYLSDFPTSGTNFN